jgi:hypothetical protein
MQYCFLFSNVLIELAKATLGKADRRKREEWGLPIV